MLGGFVGESLADAFREGSVNPGEGLIDGFQLAPHGFSDLSAGGYLYEAPRRSVARGGELLSRWAEAYTVSLAPKLLLLIPGIGAQGGDARATVAAGWRADGPIVVNSSRAVLYAGSGEGFAVAARAAARATRDELAAARAACA